MIKAHVYVGTEKVADRIMQHCPRVGDTIRFGTTEDRYAKVTEVIWCLNEGPPWTPGMHTWDRVNLRTELLP